GRVKQRNDRDDNEDRRGLHRWGARSPEKSPSSSPRTRTLPPPSPAQTPSPGAAPDTSGGGVCAPAKPAACSCQSLPFIKVAPRVVCNGTGWFPLRRVFPRRVAGLMDGPRRLLPSKSQVDESSTSAVFVPALSFDALRWCSHHEAVRPVTRIIRTLVPSFLAGVQ
ncbi:hypothetical protein MRX96_053907, partial [Rhipicephalus microplus]